jgi:hypothetical protein
MQEDDGVPVTSLKRHMLLIMPNVRLKDSTKQSSLKNSFVFRAFCTTYTSKTLIRGLNLLHIQTQVCFVQPLCVLAQQRHFFAALALEGTFLARTSAIAPRLFLKGSTR